MKRVFAFVLVLIICIPLCACSKSQSAKEFEKLVTEIDTVSLDSEEAIKTAETAYEALSDEDKEDVKESYENLASKRKEFDGLVVEAQLKAEQEERLKTVIDLIDAIGDVTLDSESAIVAAEEAYENLPDEEKAMIADSASKLAESREAYEDVVLEQIKAHAEEASAAIDAIGEVTVDSKDSIVGARELYDALTSEEKELVTNYDVLEKAEEEYDAAVAEKMAENVAEVENTIEAIGEVTLDSSNKITAAKKAYNALSSEEKSMVKNYDVLKNAEALYKEALKAEKQRILDNASSKFDIETDPIQNVTWYTPKNMPEYINTRSYIIPYIGVFSGYKWIYIRYNYTGDDWVFWQKLTILVNGKKYYRYVGYNDTVREVGGGDVWEYYDEVLDGDQKMDTEEIQMLKAISEADETIIRFEGDDHWYDLYVTDADKQMIKDTLELYEALP